MIKRIAYLSIAILTTGTSPISANEGLTYRLTVAKPVPIEASDQTARHGLLSDGAERVSIESGHRGQREEMMKSREESSVGMASATNEESIRDIESRFNRAWNAHKPDDMVESLVEDAQFITVNGVWLKSRAAFRDLVERLHAGPFKNTTRETIEQQIRFVAPDIAVVHSRFRITGDVDDDGRTIPPRDGIGTRLLRKRDGRWWTIAVQNTDVRNRRQ